MAFIILKAQKYQDLLRSFNPEDSFAVIGKSYIDTARLHPVSLIKTWQMNLRSKDSRIKDASNGDSSACDKKSMKTVHHFCMMRHDVQLPDPYKGVWSRYIVHNKYGLPSNLKVSYRYSVNGYYYRVLKS